MPGQETDIATGKHQHGLGLHVMDRGAGTRVSYPVQIRPVHIGAGNKGRGCKISLANFCVGPGEQRVRSAAVECLWLLKKGTIDKPRSLPGEGADGDIPPAIHHSLLKILGRANFKVHMHLMRAPGEQTQGVLQGRIGMVDGPIHDPDPQGAGQVP